MARRSARDWLEDTYKEVKETSPMLSNGEEIEKSPFQASSLEWAKQAPPPRVLSSPTEAEGIVFTSPIKTSEAWKTPKNASESKEEEQQIFLLEGLNAAIELVEAQPLGIDGNLDCVASANPTERLAYAPANGDTAVSALCSADSPIGIMGFRCAESRVAPLHVTRMLGIHEQVAASVSGEAINIQELYSELSRKKALGLRTKASKSVFIPNDPRYTGQRPRRLEKLCSKLSPSERVVLDETERKNAQKKLFLCGEHLVDDNETSAGGNTPTLFAAGERPFSCEEPSWRVLKTAGSSRSRPVSRESSKSNPCFLVHSASIPAVPRPEGRPASRNASRPASRMSQPL